MVFPGEMLGSDNCFKFKLPAVVLAVASMGVAGIPGMPRRDCDQNPMDQNSDPNPMDQTAPRYPDIQVYGFH